MKIFVPASALLFLTVLCGCQNSREPVTLFVAASLARAMGEVSEAVERADPRLDVRLEISGSQIACRKVAELNRRADLVLAADVQVIQRILVPAWAERVLPVAGNEVVLAHLEHSRHTDQISANNWPDVLQRPGVRLGLVDPDLAPMGYRTLLVWALAERFIPGQRGLAARLQARVPASQRVPHEGELLGRLQARALDYAFVYRSTAEDHNLKIVPLPDAYNLGEAARAREYALVQVKVRMRSSGAPVRVAGAPIRYGAAMISKAPNRAGAEAVLAMLRSKQGRRILLRRGFRPLAGSAGP